MLRDGIIVHLGDLYFCVILFIYWNFFQTKKYIYEFCIEFLSSTLLKKQFSLSRAICACHFYIYRGIIEICFVINSRTRFAIYFPIYVIRNTGNITWNLFTNLWILSASTIPNIYHTLICEPYIYIRNNVDFVLAIPTASVHFKTIHDNAETAKILKWKQTLYTRLML